MRIIKVKVCSQCPYGIKMGDKYLCPKWFDPAREIINPDWGFPDVCKLEDMDIKVTAAN